MGWTWQIKPMHQLHSLTNPTKKTKRNKGKDPPITKRIEGPSTADKSLARFGVWGDRKLLRIDLAG